jgi:von Willebrand factor type A domain-containing protein
VALLVVGGLLTARSGVVDAAGRILPWSSPEVSCPTTQVTVVSAPQISNVVRRLVGPLDGRALEDGSCLSVDLQVQSPVTTVQNAASTATAQLPQIWIPDSSLWPGQAAGWSTEIAGSMGTSPVVVATSPASLAKLHWPRTVSWPQALDTRTHGIVAPGTTDAAPGMASDAPSLLGLLSLARTLGPGTRTEQQIAATVLAASRVTAPDMAGAIDMVRKSGTRAPAVLLTDEQTVRNANRDEPKGLVAVAPAGTPAALDFPVLRVKRSHDDPVLHAATDVVVAGLTAPSARQIAAAAGFGPPAPEVTPTTQAQRSAAEQAAKSAATFVSLIRTLALPSRLLVAVDTSLSMQLPVAGGLTRIQLAVAGAIAAGKLLPDRSAIGLWTFAGRQPGGRPYQVLAKTAALSNVDSVSTGGKNATHRDVVNVALVSLPRRLSSGGTGLYDTALDALKSARRSFDPEANNAVVLFTDGADDYPAGMSLERFERLAKADAAAATGQTVRLIAIGIGPDADMNALKAMCRAAGGRAYRADSPQALQTVLFDSIAHRHVAPGQVSP